jgi:hypothetical protein
MPPPFVPALVSPQAANIERAGFAVLGVVIKAIDDGGTAAGANGLNVSLDAQLVSDIKAIAAAGEGRGAGFGGKVIGTRLQRGFNPARGTAGAESANGTMKKTRSSEPVERVMWPLPVRSSAKTIRPGVSGNFWPAVNSTSPRPLSVTTYRRSAG